MSDNNSYQHAKLFKQERRRCDALSKLNITQMAFNLIKVNLKKSINEEKATLDDDINTFSAALISCHVSLSRVMFTSNIKTSNKSFCAKLVLL